MGKLLLAALLSCVPAAAQTRASVDSLRHGCGFDGAVCASGAAGVPVAASETDRFIRKELDAASPLSGPLLEETRRGEERLVERTIEESPMLQQAFADAEKNRTWHDYYEDRAMDAAVASWSSNLKAGYYKGTAAAYATYKTAPPVVAEIGGAVLWVGGVVYGLGLGLLASAFTGHL